VNFNALVSFAVFLDFYQYISVQSLHATFNEHYLLPTHIADSN